MKKKHDLLYILSVLLVVLLCWYVSKYHYQLMLVDGQSMEPTFRDKSVVLLDKHASERRTGDVVYCRCESVGRYIVKRIAAVPGDSIRAQDGVLYINGLPSAALPQENLRAAYISDDDTIIPDGMRWKAHVDISGDLQMSSFGGVVRLSCRVKDMQEHVYVQH